MDQRRREEYLRKQGHFRTDAFKFIDKMVDWCKTTPNSNHLVDEIIHSIFFLGRIYDPGFSPEEIIADEEMLDALREKYPRPFDSYKIKLPRRSPFSCVLDMIVLLKGQNDEEGIKEGLRRVIEELEPKFLVSSTLCISQTSSDSGSDSDAVRYYGVSMSTSGPDAGQILIAASCFSYWDDYVAGAVITYYPLKVKKPYFDGTFNLPDSVRCEAFNIKRGENMNPCRSCGNLFGLNTPATNVWPYGNCAEAESLSKLLNSEEHVKNQAQPTSNTFTPQNRQRAERDVTVKLLSLLGKYIDARDRYYYYNP